MEGSQPVEIGLKNYLDSMDSAESIDISLAKSIYDQKLGVFIDAREFVDFNEGHITGAINFPYESDLGHNKELLDSLFYADKTLIIYCSGEGCSLSEDLSNDLYENHNFYSIVYFEEGYPIWKEFNYPIKKGNENNVNDSMNKDFFTFIDYIIILSIILIVGFYSYYTTSLRTNII